MNKKCIKCIDYGLKEIDCYQCYIISQYNKKSKKTFSNFLNWIGLGIFVLVGFFSANFIIGRLFGKVEFGLSFAFWGFCLFFIIYNIKIKSKVVKTKNAIM